MITKYVNIVVIERGVTRMAVNREIWKDIVGYENEYQVSNYGRVKSLPKYSNSKGYFQLRKEKILKGGYTGKARNRRVVTFRDGKSFKVSRLVATAFIPNPDNLPIVNHKDENPLNDCADNLEWCTNSYNVKYSAKPLSEEHKNKIKLAHIGMSHTEETKQKIRERNIIRYSNIEERKRHIRIIKKWWSERKCQK